MIIHFTGNFCLVHIDGLNLFTEIKIYCKLLPLSYVYSGSEDGRGQEYVYRNDWGEQMGGKHQVRIFNIIK